MTKTSKKRLSITIISISLLQMGMVSLSPVISSITQAFPGTSQVAAQTAATFLNLVLVLAALLSGKLAQWIGRKAMASGGMLLFILVACCGRFLTFHIVMVYLWSGLLGIGTGLFVPAASSMIIDYFDEQERSVLAGRQTAAVNVGGVLLSLLAGAIAAHRWVNAYLSFLIAIPVLILCLCFLPGEKRSAKQTARVSEGNAKGKIAGAIWLYTLQAVLFGIVYFTFSTNAAMLLAERNWTSTTMAGILTAVFMLGGGVFGILFSRIYGALKDKTAIGAFLLVAVSFLCIYFIKALPLMMIAAFFGGGSLSMIFPFYLIKIANHVTPETSVISTSLIISVGPNLGSFLSPVVITNLAALTGNEQPSMRFLVAAVVAIVIAVLLLIVDRVSQKAQYLCISPWGST